MQAFVNASNTAAVSLMLCLGLTLGCASPQNGQLSTCEQDKAELLATIRQQRDEVNSLRDRTASLERRLAESELEIARHDPNRSLRAAASAADGEDLSWRPPSEVAEKDDTAARR